MLGCLIICMILASRRMFLATYLSWCACFLSIILIATYDEHKQKTFAEPVIVIPYVLLREVSCAFLERVRAIQNK